MSNHTRGEGTTEHEIRWDPMIDVVSVRSLAERLVKIASDCFDRRAAERLRALADELLDPDPKSGAKRSGAGDSEDAAAA
jgi:hypothetical protein